MPGLPCVEIIRSRGAIGVQTQQREGPRARGAKALRGRQSFHEQGGSPPAPRRACVSARALAERPECSPVAVLGPAAFKPGPVEAHEVAESPRVGIPCMLHESRKTGG